MNCLQSTIQLFLERKSKMNNKFLPAIVAVQTTVMLGLLYYLWNQETNEILNDKDVLFLAIFSISCLLLAIVLHFKKPITYEEGTRRDGTVKWFNPNKGFGFIENDDGKEEQVENPDKGQLLDENDDGPESKVGGSSNEVDSDLDN